jgi:hypothetical protein
MMTLSTLAFILIVISAMIILIFRDWLINAVALAVQYLAAFILVSLSWPIGMAVIKLIVGWMATAAIALTLFRQQPSRGTSELKASLFFRGFAGLMIVFVIFVTAPALQRNIFPQLELVIIQGGLTLLAMSLMQLGTHSEPYLTVFSLLSFLSGFEVIHAGLEISTLLTGLLAVANLGLALIGVYFVVKTGETDESTQDEGVE